MSKANGEIVRAAFQAFEEGDMEAVLRLCDENIEITQAAELLGASRNQHVRGGKIAEWRLFMREEQALEALRLAN